MHKIKSSAAKPKCLFGTKPRRCLKTKFENTEVIHYDNGM